jgi:choline dehydrogenase-like flavoprotein
VTSSPAAGGRITDPDVVVIGSGAGGAVITKELAEAGLSVVVLEVGRRFDPQEFPTDRPDWEAKSPAIFAPADPRRDLYTSSNSFQYNRVKGVGGTTLHYQGVSPRLHESDFMTRTQDGVGADWPIRYADLEPYYSQVEYGLGVAGPSGVDANPFDPPRSQPYPTPPHPFDRLNLMFARGASSLGLHLVASPTAIPSVSWMGRPRCNEAGTCNKGCRLGAKSSMDLTYMARAEATGRVDVRTNCMAREITLRPDGRARSVVYLDRSGSEHELSGRAVVVAGNAIETPRLLLMSTSGRFRNGLANSSGLVGKYFVEHLSIFASGTFEERVDPWRGIPTKGLMQDFYATNSAHTFARGWSLETSSGNHWPVTTATRVGGWGSSHKKRMRDAFGHTGGLWAVGEQLPDIRNEITLDRFRTDSFGLPIPHIINEPRENDRAMIAKMPGVLSRILEASGARDIRVAPFVPGGSSHYLGTCRMGTEPDTSVVDAWCRSHDVPNLFIGDGSAMVTGGGVNPALTISALAARTVHGMIAAFKAGTV